MQRLLSILGAFFHWCAAGRTRSELRQLSDRTLRDIGLSRHQIDSLFR